MRVLDSIYVYWRFLAVSIRAQMQYKASFLMQLGGRLVVTAGEFMAILVLFDRFDSLIGWSVYQVAFIYGIVNISFAVADAMTTGFDLFGDMVKSGDFDRILTRPRSTALQLAGQELTLRRISRLTPGFGSADLGSNAPRPDLDCSQRGVVIGLDRWRRVSVLRIDRASSHPCVLDDRDFGDDEYAHLRRSRDYPVPRQHLQTLVPKHLYLRYSISHSQLLSCTRDHGSPRPARNTTLVPIRSPTHRNRVPDRLAPSLENRSQALPLYGKLRLSGDTLTHGKSS